MQFLDLYQPRALCALGLIDALALFERWIIKERGLDREPTLPRAKFLELAQMMVQGRNPNKDPQRPLHSFLVPKNVPGSTEFSAKNVANVQPVYCEFVANLLREQYFCDGSPYSLLFQEKDGSPECDLIERISKLREPQEIHNCLNAAHPDQSERKGALARFISQAFGQRWKSLRHPDFPSLDIFDAGAVAVESHSPPEDERDKKPNWGLFAVIREARGWTARTKQEINLLVRDIIWLPPPSKDNKDKKTRSRGFYASAVDGECFIIEPHDVHHEEKMVIGLAQLAAPKHRTQRTRFMFAQFDEFRPLQLSHGLITGTTGEDGDPIFGAWKALIVRPDWTSASKLEGLLEFGNPKVNEANRAFDLLSDAGATGVIFSEALRKTHPAIQGRRMGFRALVANDMIERDQQDNSIGELISGEIQSRLESKIAEVTNSLDMLTMEDSDIADKVIDVFNDMVAESWNYIEPAQIIMFKKADALKDLHGGVANSKDTIETIAHSLLAQEHIDRVSRKSRKT